MVKQLAQGYTANDLDLCYLDLNLGVLHNHCFSIYLVVISEAQDLVP